MKKLFGNRKFTAAFFVTLILIFFTAGILTVDYRGRSVFLGDRSPLIDIKHGSCVTVMDVNMLGIQRRIDISSLDRIARGFFEFICVPYE